MQDDSGEGSPYGSLLELFPHLADDAAALPLSAVHVRALVVEEGASPVLTFVVWSDPGSTRALRKELGERIEAALLAYICRSPDALREAADPPPARLRVVVVPELPADRSAAFAPFGLVPVELGAEGEACLALVRGEAQRVGVPAPDRAAATLEVPMRLPDGPRGDLAIRLEQRLLGALAGEIWGRKPGAFHRALSAAFVAEGEAPLPTTVEALDRIEGAVGQLVPGRIRFVPPLVFQALADTVAVIAATEFRRKVDWAESDEDENGLPSPPLFRAKLSDGLVHIPIGEHLLRWSLMPLAPHEVPPGLSEWATDQFGDRATAR